LIVEEELLDRLLQKLDRGREEQASEPWAPEAWQRRAAAEELRHDLFGLSAAERRRLDQRFHSRDLIALLLEDSQAVQIRDPEDAAHLAGLALLVAEVMRDKKHLGSDAVVRAGRMQANALRLLGERLEAEHAFATARFHLDDESPERPFFCRSLALLRWEQQWLDEAAALLQHAAFLFHEQQAAEEEGASLLLLGVLGSETTVPGRGLPPLAQGWTLIRPARHPWLSLCGGFVLAALLGEVGQPGRGRAVLSEAIALYGSVREESQILQGYRLEAVARARLGEICHAEELLDAVRRKQLERRDLAELALTSLELGAVRAELGRAGDVACLGEDLAGFDPEEGGTFAVEALAALQAGLAEGRKPRQEAARLAAEFRRLCRLFNSPLEPVSFA